MRKLFGTDGIRGLANKYPMTIEVCQKLAKAIIVKFCPSKEKKHLILIGEDTRLSRNMFSCAMQAVFYSHGVDVLPLGCITTPKLSIMVEKAQASCGIMISASHNPFYDNGIKLFNKFGLKLTEAEEEELETTMEEKCPISIPTGIALGRCNYDNIACAKTYINDVKQAFGLHEETLQNTKIVVDFANGSSFYSNADFFVDSGFNTVFIGDNPTGTNINENCGSTYPNIISEAVLENKADIGIAFDGDGDRVIIADENGKILDGDHILAILATAEKCDKVVSTIMSNYALEKYLTSIGVELIKTQVGDKHVTQSMLKANAKFGAESSGHIIIASHAYTGDGLFAAMKVLKYMIENNKKCSELRLFETYPTVSTNLNTKDKSIILKPDIQKQIQKFEQQLLNRGKLIVRASGTEPLIRISAEGENKEELQKIVNEISSIIESSEQ